MTALIFAKTIYSRPVRSRCACTEVRLCVEKTELCLSLNKLKEEGKNNREGTMLVYRGNVCVVYILSTVKTENTYMTRILRQNNPKKVLYSEDELLNSA